MSATATSFGIIYVAARAKKYLLDASLSALSCRKMGYTGPICLFTNIQVDTELPDFLFNTVVPITENHQFSDNWTTGKHHKLQSLIESPYDLTLYLDADTRAYSPDIATFCNLLKNYDIAMTSVGPANSYTARTLNAYLYNAGVIAYKKSETMTLFLKDWQTLSRSHHAMLADGAEIILPDDMLAGIPRTQLSKLLRMDQLGLYILLNPEKSYQGISVKTLSKRWNNRNHDFNFPADTIIHHSNRYHRRFKEDIHELLNSEAIRPNRHAVHRWLSLLLDS